MLKFQDCRMIIPGIWDWITVRGPRIRDPRIDSARTDVNIIRQLDRWQLWTDVTVSSCHSSYVPLYVTFKSHCIGCSCLIMDLCLFYLPACRKQMPLWSPLGHLQLRSLEKCGEKYILYIHYWHLVECEIFSFKL